MISRLAAAWTLPLLEQREHLLESAAVTAPEELVDGHLGAGDERARSFHAAEAHGAILLGTRSHGVTCHVHGIAALERAEHGLGDANVGFDPRHDELVACSESLQPVEELGAAEAAEAHLVERDGGGCDLEDFWHRGAESPAVLRGEEDGQAEDVGELQEEHAVAQDAVAARDGREQLLLQVHDDERRALGTQQARGRSRRHRVSQGRIAAQARTASCISSRWPEKKWSASGTITACLGSGSLATRSRRAGPGPNASFAPCTNSRGRAHVSRKDGSVTICIGKPRANTARARASAQPARSAITEP